jgi:hypothetical protein
MVIALAVLFMIVGALWYALTNNQKQMALALWVFAAGCFGVVFEFGTWWLSWGGRH